MNIPNFDTFIDVLQDRARRTPDKIIYYYLGDGENVSDSITYSELEKRAKLLALQLLNTLDTGDRAILSYPTGLEFIVAFYACLYAGIVAVPVMPAMHEQDIKRVIKGASNCKACIILSSQILIEKLNLLEQGAGEITWYATDQPCIQHCIKM